jgi:8-oxo-dGTP diphosphatase
LTEPPVPQSDRHYPKRPIVGVGALLFDGDQVLLIQRGKPPLEGYWALPGGAVEAGERLEDAMIREVFEETGLHISADSIATVFERIMPDTEGRCEYHYVLIDFYCTIQGGELRPGDDSRDARWFRIAELETLLVTAGTREVVLRCHGSQTTHPVITRP